MSVNDMVYGMNELEVAVIKAEEKESLKGNSYMNVTITDGENILDIKAWKTKAEFDIVPPAVINAKIKKEDYNGSVSYILWSWVKTSRDYKELLPHAPINPEEEFNYLLSLSDEMKDMDLHLLTKMLLENNKEAFIASPAAKSIHHNYISGLLYHTVRMVRNAVAMTAVYPDLNKDLLVAGTMLHDIGKLKEMQMDAAGAVSYTLDGNMFGHILIGIQMIDEAMRNYGLKETENTKLLKHMIAAHHGKLEYGAIALPMTKEAMVLNQIDMIDSRIWQYEKAEAGLKPGEMSDKIFGLDGAVVYKPM